MKKILLSLFVCFVGFIGFSNAENYSDIVQSITLSVNSGYNYDWFMCIWPTNSNCWVYTKIFINSVQVDWFPAWQNHKRLWCWNWNINFVNWHTNWYDCTYNVYTFSGFNLNCPECQECTICPTTWEVISWSVDTNYCVENDLCPVPSNFSQLFINDIEHPWTPLINVSIPDYITWDYVTSSWQFDLYVWSWYDEEYIQSIIDINSYRPDSGDFTNIFVSGLTLIMPYIIIVLFIVFVWKLLRRVFK